MKSVKLFLLVLTFFLTQNSTPAHALLLSPSADATIFDFDPKDGVPNFINHAGSQAFNGPFGESRALLEFDLSSLSGSISSAILDLDVVAELGPYPMTLSVYAYSGDGFITNPDFGAGDFLYNYDYQGESNVLLDLTSRINDYVGTGTSFAGINIRGTNVSTINNAPYVAFHNTDDPRSALLRINENANAVPEPSTFCLIGLWGVGMAGYRNFRAKKNQFKN